MCVLSSRPSLAPLCTSCVLWPLVGVETCYFKTFQLMCQKCRNLTNESLAGHTTPAFTKSTPNPTLVYWTCTGRAVYEFVKGSWLLSPYFLPVDFVEATSTHNNPMPSLGTSPSASTERRTQCAYIRNIRQICTCVVRGALHASG